MRFQERRSASEAHPPISANGTLLLEPEVSMNAAIHFLSTERDLPKLELKAKHELKLAWQTRVPVFGEALSSWLLLKFIVDVMIPKLP
jgi:hypothetical protein